MQLSQEIEPFLSLYTPLFPQRERVRVTTVADISTGWEGDLFSLTLDYEEGQVQKTAEVVLKLYYGQDGIQKADREWYCLRGMSGIGYPVPRPLFAVLHASPFGRPGVAMEKIQGQTAAQIFEQADQETRQALMTQCCQLYIALHTLDWVSLVPPSMQRRAEDSLPSWFAHAKAKSGQQLPGVFDPVLDWLQEQSKKVVCQRLSVTHGDFHLNNILMKEDNTPCVIDWTGANIEDYRFDLAWTLMLMRTHGEAEQATMMQSTYERLADHPPENLEFFETIACFKRLFEIAVSLQSGAATLGMKPGAEAEMKQQSERIKAVYTLLQQHVASPLPYIEQLILSLEHQHSK